MPQTGTEGHHVVRGHLIEQGRFCLIADATLVVLGERQGRIGRFKRGDGVEDALRASNPHQARTRSQGGLTG